jgi:rhodanese-related sulfurtransferase
MAVLLRAVVIVAGGALAGVLVNAARPAGLALGRYEPPAQCDGEGESSTEIAPDDAIRLCGHPEVVIADARNAEEFEKGHVAGAIHLPCDAGGRMADDAAAHFGPARMIIVYGQTTDDALPVAAGLRRRIHRPGVRVVVLRGGFAAWDRAGLACASGPCDECKESIR